jgi:hypothetical protein
MRAILLAFTALCLTGCAGTKFNLGYDLQAKQFFLQLEKPLESGLKK